jgi:hypothetical protein
LVYFKIYPMSEVNDSIPQGQYFSETNVSEATIETETKVFTYDEGSQTQFKFSALDKIGFGPFQVILMLICGSGWMVYLYF